MKTKLMRKNRGITLIALVITIIILLILAGVTIAQLTGNGLFSKATKAVSETQIAADKEEIQLKFTEYSFDQISGGDKKTFLEYLDERKQSKDYKVEYLEEGNHEIGYITIEDRKYLMDTTDGKLNMQYIGKGEKAALVPVITKLTCSVTSDGITVEIQVNQEDANIEYAITQDGKQIGETIETKEKTHTFSGLTGGQTYTIIIIAKNENGSTYRTASAKPVSLNELVKGKAKFVINPDSGWQKSVTATIQSEYTATGDVQLQYSQDDGETWTKYTGGFTVSDNITLYGRFYNTKTGEESDYFSISITIIDKEQPKIEQSFNEGELKLKVSVQDAESGLQSVKISKLTSETATGEITSTELENKEYTGTVNGKEEFEYEIKAPYQQYLRGYEIIAIDKAGNENTVTVNNLSIQNLSLIIKTEQELIDFATIVNEGTTFVGQTVQLGNDITMTKTFTPIGVYDSGNDIYRYFDGTFNGNGYTINNLTISHNHERVGLFGMTGTNSNITNVKLDNCNIQGTNNAYQVGGIIGYSQGNVSLCGVNGTIKGATEVGGIIGQQVGTKTVEKCYSEGTITTYWDTNDDGGGIIGEATSTVTVNNVYSTATVNSDGYGGITGTGGKISNAYYVGEFTNTNDRGSISYKPTSVTNCFWNEETIGSIQYLTQNGNKVQISRLTHKEGLTGFDFENVWAIDEGKSLPYLKELGKSATVTSKLEGFDIMNGIGTAESPYEISTAKQLNQVRYELDANYKMTANIDMTDITFKPIGGYNQELDDYLYFNGTFNGDGHTISNLTISYNYERVGLFGMTGTNSNITNVKLDNCNISSSEYYVGGIVGYSQGNVSLCGVNGTIKGTGGETGGIIGYQLGAKTVEKCYSEGTISINNYYVGGIVGTSASTVTIKDVYSTATIKGDYKGGITGKGGKISNAYYAGIFKDEWSRGSISSSPTSVTSCFWNTETIGNLDGLTQNGTGLSTADMQKASTYSAWDTSIWNIVDGSYPTLKIDWK